MADALRDDFEAALLPASFRGAPFLVERASAIGGLKATEMPIVYSDAQAIPVLGVREPVYNVQGFVAPRYGTAQDGSAPPVLINYFDVKRQLLAALNGREPGVLVLPSYGALSGMLCKNWALDETQQESGIGRISMEFVRDTTRATPVAVEDVIESVSAATKAARESAVAQLGERWSVSTSVLGAYDEALTKARSAYTAIESAASRVENAADQVDRFSVAISKARAAVTRVILAPLDIADSVKGLFDSLRSVLPSADAAFRTLIEGFKFGSLDVEFGLDSPGARQRRQSQDAMNGAMRALFLSEAYDAAAGLDLTRLDRIEYVEAAIDAEHRSLVESGLLPTETVELLEDARVAFTEFMGASRATALKISEQTIGPTTPRTLEYAFRGSDARADEIAELNGVLPYQLLSGSAKVLTV